MAFTFTIPGRVQPKQRPRHTRGGRTYTPAETSTYEQHVRAAYRQAVGPFLGDDKAGVPLRADIEIFEDLAVVTLTELDGPRSTVAGDCDNLAKGILDALNKVAYHDDRAVTELLVVRHLKSAQ